MMGTWAQLTTRIGIIAVVLVLLVFSAYVRGETPSTTFATYGIDLRVDSRAFYNGEKVSSSTWKLKNLVPGSDHFFDFDDLKPGDFGKTIISLHVKKQKAWMCLDFSNLESADNDQNEPEALVDDEGDEGELLEGIEFFGWQDDGDNEFGVGEEVLFDVSHAGEVLDDTTYTIEDFVHGYGFKVNEVRYVGILWCAGELSVNTQTAAVSCDGSVLGNEVQTDTLSVDIALRAFPVKDRPQFQCEGKKFPKHPYPWWSGYHINHSFSWWR
jgi:hypothetical protein